MNSRTFPRPPDPPLVLDALTELRLLDAARPPPGITGEGRAEAESAKRRQLCAELRLMLDAPLHKPMLTEAERRAIHDSERERQRGRLVWP